MMKATLIYFHLLMFCCMPACFARQTNAISKRTKTLSTHQVKVEKAGIPKPVAIATQLDKPKWWIAAKDSKEGRLFLGVPIRNNTDSWIITYATFHLYNSDGHEFGSGSGTQQWIRLGPKEKGFVYLEWSTVPANSHGYQVTSRISAEYDVTPPLLAVGVKPKIVDCKFSKVSNAATPDEKEEEYEAVAHIQLLSPRDAKVTVAFRFYDNQGFYIGELNGGAVLLQPEISRRVDPHGINFLVYRGSPEPKSVRVVLAQE